MIAAFGTLFNQMTGLFALMLIGFWMNRSKMFPKATENVLANLSTKLFLPALLFSTFLKECTPQNLVKYGSWVLYGTAFTLLCMILFVRLARPLSKGQAYTEKVYRYSLVIPNTGAFAMPIVQAMFESEVFFQYQLFVLPLNFFCYSWGIAQLMPQGHQGTLKDNLSNIFNPVFIATLAGMALGLTGINNYLPNSIHTALQNLSNGYTPVTLLLTGFVIGNYPLKELIANKMSYVFSIVRLLIIPGIFLVVLRLLNAPQMLCVLTCLVFACPCGMNTVIYPAALGEDTRPGASLVLVTTFLSVITIPLLYALL